MLQTVDVDVKVQDRGVEEWILVCGSSSFSSAAADAAADSVVTDVVPITVVSGSSCYCSAVAEWAAAMAVDVTTAADADAKN